MGKQNLDYIVCSFLWNGIMKDSSINMDMPVFDTPGKPLEGPYGDPIELGVIEHWNNEADGLKGDQDGLNEHYRQFPRTTEHAFRDETQNSIYNLVKIYEQIDYNEDLRHSPVLTRGSFQLGKWYKRY